MKKLAGIFLVVVLLFACRKDEVIAPVSEDAEAEFLQIPEGFPNMDFPEDNQYTNARWKLGKMLFYEKRLSIDQSISCASCHNPKLAFADKSAVSFGAYGRAGSRNAPSLSNIGYHPYFLREGSVPTLEMQVLVPIQEHNEFDHNIVEIGKILQQDSIYISLSKKAYARLPDAFVITRALAVFQRSMISGNSKYDQYNFQGKKTALNEIEKKGMDLFFSNRTNCSECHSGFNFSNYSFQNNGLYENYDDIGRQRFSNKSSDEGLFKVPSLRNVELTPPYMHDGSLKSLEEVVEHYNSGGKPHKNKSPLLHVLSLNEEEKKALLAFLKNLSDQDFVSNTIWQKQ